MELLSPAGSYECIYPAVRMGADAVYLGASLFSARASAKNFSDSELIQAIEYCHGRGVKVYLALNTLLRDDELSDALTSARFAVNSGIDAVIVQDLGLAYLLRQACPGIRLHASTQMSVHTPEGAKLLYNMGFSRVVLSRELSENEIKEIVDSCPIETEVFVHGALCMSVSGQCYFSAIAGLRSGNRGKCAQPCRLPFCVNNSTDKESFALSLKDLSIIKHLKRLEKIGVTSAKIEGRMKRPEYVAMSVYACRKYLDTGSLDSEAQDMLQAVFSRSGFTDGYYTSNRGKDMFGVRLKENVVSADSKLFKKIRAMYNKEQPLIPVSGRFVAVTDKELSLELSDNDSNTVKITDAPPESAVNLPLDDIRAKSQLSKMGGTPFYSENIEVLIKGSPAVSVSQLNLLRRNALEKLLEKRIKRNIPVFNMPDLQFHKNDVKNRSQFTKRYVCQISDISDEHRDSLIFVPWNSDLSELTKLKENGFNIGLELPRGMFGSESRIKEALLNAKSHGITHILTGNLGGVALGIKNGFTVHGDFGLNVMNSYAVLCLSELGCRDVVVSIELTFSQISKLVHYIPAGIFSQGHIPLMLTRNCPCKSADIKCSDCKISSKLTDRSGRVFPIVCNNGCAEILNCVPLKSDKKDIAGSKADFEVIRTYQRTDLKSGQYTHGLYRRGSL